MQAKIILSSLAAFSNKAVKIYAQLIIGCILQINDYHYLQKQLEHTLNHGLLEEYGRISHILAMISKRPTFSSSEQPHRAVSVRNASMANSFRSST